MGGNVLLVVNLPDHLTDITTTGAIWKNVMIAARINQNNGGNLLFYTFYDSIAFVGQTVFQSFTTNVVVLEEKMVNKGLRRFFLVNGKRIRQLQQRFACLKKATFRPCFSC